MFNKAPIWSVWLDIMCYWVGVSKQSRIFIGKLFLDCFKWSKDVWFWYWIYGV